MVCLKNTAKTPPKGGKKEHVSKKNLAKPRAPRKNRFEKKGSKKKLVFFLFFGEGNMGQVMGRLIWLPKLAIQPGAGVWVQLRIASLKEI